MGSLVEDRQVVRLLIPCVSQHGSRDHVRLLPGTLVYLRNNMSVSLWDVPEDYETYGTNDVRTDHPRLTDSVIVMLVITTAPVPRRGFVAYVYVNGLTGWAKTIDMVAL